MASALPRAVFFFLLLIATAAWAQDEADSSPISLPPASLLDQQDAVADSASPPYPCPQPPPNPPPLRPRRPHHHHSAATPDPAPAAAADKTPGPAPAAADKDNDEHEKKKKKAPAPAPAAAEVKATSTAGNGDAEPRGDDEGEKKMDGGKKAGVVVGAFTAAAVVGLGAFVWKKRRANIRRARYADYSARLELV
ncbi:hypothetical protein PR202_gb10216 [Eleusine coracana subsp. coracana]|uniref:Uncharacterized protein n=1 Tax=Eleusine coracana subsp. coracana TaxID=191504 RepID=A0AAV5EJ59_ELECO|nr:hypothetical protein PR202_gb10216 [Eleusine coracana subsp. coracana]